MEARRCDGDATERAADGEGARSRSARAGSRVDAPGPAVAGRTGPADAPAARRPHGGADAPAGSDRGRRGGLRRATRVARAGGRLPELPARHADDHSLGRGVRRRGRFRRGAALARAGRTPRSSPGRPWGCPHFWASPRPPSCWPSGGRSTPRWARPARRWMRPSSTPTCSSSGPSRSGYSTPPRVSCAAGATPPTLPPLGPSREPSRSRSPRSSSSRRASGSPAPRGPCSATTS